MISMNQAWDDAVAFIRRESTLLVPLALATFLVSDVVGTLVGPKDTGAQPSGLATLFVLIATLWSIVGQLSIMSLVLKPGLSVAEALRIGISRLGKVVIVALILAAVFVVAMLPVVVSMLSSGVNPALPDTFRNLPVWASLYALFAMGGLVWLAVRMILANALIVDRNPGISDVFKTGFALTRGIVAQIFLVLLIYVIVLLILSGAVRFVAGSLFALIGGAIGSPFAGAVMTALVSGLVSAALSLVAAVFVASLYRRVSRGT